MKTYIKFILLIIICILMVSCTEKKDENVDKIPITNLSIIEKLSVNDFYAIFFNYNIWPREDGRVFIISTDSFDEFWANFSKTKGVNLLGDENLGSYRNEILAELYKLISFMHNYGIKSVTHVQRSRIDFQLLDDDEIRWYASISNRDIKLFNNYFNKVEVIDSNWVILKYGTPRPI